MASALISLQQSWQNALTLIHFVANAAFTLSCCGKSASKTCSQNKDSPQEEFESKMADLKKELGYWESYLGSNEYLAGSQFSLAGGGVLCVP